MKIARNQSTPESKEFWESAEHISEKMKDWPDSKRAGINESSRRTEQTLREWIKEHPIDENMLWRESTSRQFDFFEDLAPVLAGYKAWQENLDSLLTVVSTHRSKSILLPVVRYQACDGNLIVLLRGNFYDYSATFFSKIPINCDFFKLPVGKISCGFEGFEASQIKDVYRPGCKEFSVQVGNKYQLWTICFLVRSAIERDLRLEL